MRLVGTWKLPPERNSDQHPLRVPGIRLRQVPGGTLVQLTRDTEAVSTLTWTVRSHLKCQLWGQPGVYLLDTAHFCYMTFGVPGDPQLYAIKQDDWAALFVVTDVLALAWVDAHDALTPRPANISITPPPPPIIIVTSDNGGQDFPIGANSNPYTIQVGFQALTQAVSMYFFGFGAGGSTPHHPGPPDGGLPAAAMYPGGTPDWHTLAFPGANASRHDRWPLLAWYDSAMNPGGTDNPQDWDAFFVWWPAWRVVVFAITADWPGHGVRFEPNMVWYTDNEVSSFLKSNQRTHEGSPPFTVPAFINEVICIRGDLTLPPLPAGATVLSITWNSFVSGSFHAADVFLNDASLHFAFAGIGEDPPESLTGLDISSTFPHWQWGGYNLVSLLASATYLPVTQLHAGAWLGIVFTILEAGGSQYRQPPIDWRTGGGGLYIPAATTDAGPFFDMAVAHALLATPGVNGRAYFYATFTIPDVDFSTATLWITAETGIGEIVVNAGAHQFLVTRDETINLWSSNTALRFTIPHGDLIRNALNSLAVQAYSSDASCRLVFKIAVNP